MDWKASLAGLRRRLRRRHRERPEWLERLEDVTRNANPFRFVVGGLGLLFGVTALLGPTPWPEALGLLAVLLTPLGLLREAFLRAGWPMAAARVAWLDDYTFGRDKRGAIPAALAIAALRGVPGAAEQLDHRVPTATHLTAGVVLGAAVRAFLQGADDEARLLLALVPDFDTSVRPAIVRRVATELGLALAAAQGDLRALLAASEEPRAASTAATRLFRLVARRALGEPLPEGMLRSAALLVAPLGAALPLVDRVTALPAATVRSPRLRSALSDEARAWDARLADPAWQARWRARAAELGARIDPVDATREAVVAELAGRLDRAVRDAPDPPEVGPLWTEVVRRVAERRFERLRALSAELVRRTRGKEAVPLVDEVLASLRVDEAAEAVCEVDEGQRVAVHLACWGPLVNHAVGLHNERGQRTLANALYRLQERRAQAAGHPQATELLRKNVGCGP